MDTEMLRKGNEMRRTMEGLKRSIDAWERQEDPVSPYAAQMFLHNIDKRIESIPSCDAAAWKVYRRASIEFLQREHDKVEAEFNRL